MVGGKTLQARSQLDIHQKAKKQRQSIDEKNIDEKNIDLENMSKGDTDAQKSEKTL